ncbi:MAG: EamA family transporter [Candidatus Diapherotrites archaeon]|nr:EamA family transporter [Candidatus Diapherotrites archaeon]
MALPDPVWALVAFVLMAFGARFFFYEGVRQVPADVSSIIMLLEPVGATVFGWVLLSQALSFESVLGALLLLSGIYLLYTRD